MMDENPSAAMADKIAIINADLKRNPPAFPVAVPSDFQFVHHGMTLRDYFAGRAVGSVMHLCASDTLLPGESIESAFARKAYAIADALLAARGPQ